VRFLVDESTGLAIARFLSSLGHDAVSVYDVDSGAPDPRVLARALAEDRILVTSDKDFGELVFRDGQAHAGVILLRLADQHLQIKTDVLLKVLAGPEDLTACFVVASEDDIRVVHFPGH